MRRKSGWTAENGSVPTTTMTPPPADLRRSGGSDGATGYTLDAEGRVTAIANNSYSETLSFAANGLVAEKTTSVAYGGEKFVQRMEYDYGDRRFDGGDMRGEQPVAVHGAFLRDVRLRPQRQCHDDKPRIPGGAGGCNRIRGQPREPHRRLIVASDGGICAAVCRG